jgi:uncharacterized protein YyaL (SSP411 family)
MNRLSAETSPYLLQHAHNPVDWYPWGEEALKRAKREDKPILVSIGYSACHWCHVMERESFENPDTARIMNEQFINIKVDREERPDLDHLYMDAVQAMAGSGGWPLNVFLTPDGKPFYGGTYFPPVNMHNRPSWRQVLHGLSSAFREKRSQIEEQAEAIRQHLEKANAFGIQPTTSLIPGEASFQQVQLEDAFQQVMAQADQEWGGFGRAPKFPQTFSILFLLRYHHFTGSPASLAQAGLSLDAMVMGGIYDQIGGGFARYSTDTEWLAPHFEKMLYDNALIVSALSDAFQLTGSSYYERAIRETLAFVEQELMSPDAIFYSALDADSEGVEGKFYTWSRQDVLSLLEPSFGMEKAVQFCRLLDITEEGNWEHTNIPRLKTWPEPDQEQLLEEGKKILYAARSKRVRPGLDHKQLLGWNALMNIAYSKAGIALREPHFLKMARRNMDALLRVFGKDGHYLHTALWDEKEQASGRARIPAFLDDLAPLALALLHLYEWTGELAYLHRADTLVQQVTAHFSDEEGLFFYFSSKEQSDILVRKKEIYDGATPSGNAQMAVLLWRLGIYMEKPGWKERALRMVEAVRPMIVRYPTSFGVWLDFLQELVAGTPEIAIFGNRLEEVVRDLLHSYLPYRVIQVSAVDNQDFALLRGRKTIPGKTVFYICRQYACKAPVYSVEEAKELLRERKE